MNLPEGLIEQLTSWKRVVVVGHVTPDADCLASMLAIAGGLEGKGRRDMAVSLPGRSVSQRLAFMVDWARPVVADAKAFAEADGFVVVDTARASRCNIDKSIPANWADGKVLINIDHHASNTRFGTINWVDESAGGTSELTHGLLRAAKAPLSPLLCSLLYAGIVTDTVGFTLATTSPQTLRAAADLVASGADVAEVGLRIYRSRSPGEFRLLRTIYGNTHLTADGRIAYSTASYEELTAAGCTAADIDEQVNVPRSVGGIEIAMLLTEGNPGRTRINFRGESGTRVLELARSLGGGGHAEAAGAILDMKLDQAVSFVLSKATEYLDSQRETPEGQQRGDASGPGETSR